MVRQPDRESERRPYAAAANVVAVLDRVRSRNLPAVINDEFLAICGIGSAVYGRVIQTLQFLRLIALDGSPTDRLRRMAAAPDTEYRKQLEECMREAYAEDFTHVNPEQDSQQQIVEAFRRYEPRSQTQRMVMLFLGLCREARIPVLEATRDRPVRAAVGRGAKPNGANRRPPARGQHTSEPPESRSRVGLLFGLTDDDVSRLSDKEFEEVWTALGKVARARARKPPGNNGDEEVNAE